MSDESINDQQEGYNPFTMGFNMEEGEESQDADNSFKKFTQDIQKNRQTSEAAIRECYGIKDIVSRAKALAREGAFDYPETEMKNDKTLGLITKNKSSYINRQYFMDVLFDHRSGSVPYPFFDTFSVRTIDHNGQPFDKLDFQPREILMASAAAGLESQNFKDLFEVYNNWTREEQHNDLIHRFFKRLPKEWDGVSRLENFVDLLKCFDTPMNRLASKYFWLSLYNRITNPGCNTPVTISFIGGQDVGKSFLSVQICWYLMQDKSALPVPFDVHKDSKEMLRAITGHSLVANIGEMQGWARADMNKIKSFTTSSSDNFDNKYEGNRVVPRQWITIMDGNKYEGLQRDDTGNRRFYPIFVGQTPDEDGVQCWYGKKGSSVERIQFSVDYKGYDFENAIWQIMAECRDWFEEHGQHGYEKLVKQTSDGVAAFSDSEMQKDRGTMKDEALSDYLKPALICMGPALQMKANAKSRGGDWNSGAIKLVMQKAFGKQTWDSGIKTKFDALGMKKASNGSWRLEFVDQESSRTRTEDEALIELNRMVIVGRDRYIAGDYDMSEVDEQIADIFKRYKKIVDKALGREDIGGF